MFNPLWQVTFRSTVMGFYKELHIPLPFFLLLFYGNFILHILVHCVFYLVCFYLCMFPCVLYVCVMRMIPCCRYKR